jgi:hypothetical protein
VNWEAIGALGELIGAAAVVLTLFYLARQVREASEEARQNQVELRRTRYDALNRELARTVSDWGANPEVAEIMLRGHQSPTSLSQPEVFRFYAAQQRFFRNLEALFIYSAEGGIHDWGAEGWRSNLCDYITFPGVRGYWEDRRHFYSEAFQAEVERLMSDQRAVMAEAYDRRSGQPGTEDQGGTA